MFKKGDYIVVLEKPNGNLTYLPPGYVYKQFEDSYLLDVEKDILYGRTNCSDVIYTRSEVWRYATQEEADEYERRGEPYRVTTFKKFVLSKNWYVVVTEENKEVLSKWRFEDDSKGTSLIGKIVGISLQGDGRLSKGHNPKNSSKGNFFDFGEEITFDQFKKYVLKQDYTDKHLLNLIKKLKIK